MPLLRKQNFEKHVELDLRDDEEVFYCEITDEIFRNYHDFAERMFLCNSMVWTCCMTGKAKLTYQEALESEQHAVQSLKKFPSELKLPIIYLATHTKRTFFGEMADDIFTYIKDRYFVGENVEACFTSNKWKDCHIISVMAPNEEQYKHEIKANGDKSPPEKHFVPCASLYKYEIEHLDEDDSDISEIMMVDNTQLRRKKVLFSRDKCKLFLKQNVEQDSRGIFVIKADSLEKYNAKDVMWETIFDGPLPNFQSSRNFDKAVSGKKRQRQETLSKYLQKNGLVMKKETQGQANKENKNDLLEQLRKREEEFKKQKQAHEEQKALKKQIKKEEGLRLAQYLKDWLKLKEDLELEDHVRLPVPTPVKCKVPDRYFGDVLSILEFVHSFPKILSTKDFFPGGFSLEVLERALTEKEVAGPLTDLIQMLLVAIFNCQEEESNNYNTGTESLKDIKEENISTTPSVEEGTHLATLASKWPITYQGLPIGRLPLYSLTVSEVLRLHLLSSGARIKETGAKWRYAQRGGYTSEDDPGLYLRLHHAHIIKALAIHNVVQLSIGKKIKVISCLMNQILTYADVRDIVEERIEKTRNTKQQLRSTKTAERKREMLFVAQKSKVKREMAEDPDGLRAELEKLTAENERKRVELQRNIEKLSKIANEGQVFLGRDRAYRQYIKFDSVPGVFVNWEDQFAGTCLEKATVQYPDLANADKTQLMEHLKKFYESPTANGQPPIKNGDSCVNKNEEAAKSPKKVNGIMNSLIGPDLDTYNELLLCTAIKTNCPVHTENPNRQKWSFFHQKEQIEHLISALNKRGLREGELKEVLKGEQGRLCDLIAQTPVGILNSDVEIKLDDKEERSVRVKKKDRYEDANLGYPPEMNPEEVFENALIEIILEMEMKISNGALGLLPIKDRDKWRNCLQNKNYKEFEMLKKSGDNNAKHLKVKNADKERSRSNTPENPYKKEEKEYQDPGRFLGETVDSDSADSETETPEDIKLVQAENTRRAIRCLANALCHVAEAVEPKHIKRPLGHADVRSSNKNKGTFDVMEKWEQSLLASTSFSQVFLHYGTLDSCVMWSRSALQARCQICRRQKDSENMLLCDSCNLGHHMYCLKPKLTAVPKGDWFCDRCKKEKEKQEKLLNPEQAKKKRRIFVEEPEEDEEEEEQDSGNEDVGEGEESSEVDDTSEGEDEENGDIKLDLCKSCGSGGETIPCEKCECSFHKECVDPPLRRLPRVPWSCPSCSNKRRHDKPKENDCDSLNLTGFTYSQRRSAAKASRKIHAFAKALRVTDNKMVDSDDNDEDEDNEIINKRSLRREEKRDDLPLNNAALQELLSDIMKHEAVWPFLRPVNQREVPDYYEIIKEPMDFGTIKYKLNMGEYSTDSQVMRDVVLIFENCNTYNSSSDEVYQCGVKLLAYLSKKAKEMGLTVPPELEEDSGIDKEPKRKRQKAK